MNLAIRASRTGSGTEPRARALVRGYALGSLSMTCYGVGVEGACPIEASGAAGIPSGVPADQSNI